VVGEVDQEATCGHHWEAELPVWPPDEVSGEPPAPSGYEPVTLQAYQGDLLVAAESGVPPRVRATVADPNQDPLELPRYDNLSPALTLADAAAQATCYGIPEDSGAPCFDATPGKVQLRRPQRGAATANGATLSSGPQGQPRLIVGPATVHVEADVTWPGCTETSTVARQLNLEVGLWDVTPKARQVFVQSGWKAVTATCDEGSARIAADVATADIAHLFRAGSNVRLTISATGYTTPVWKLAVPDGHDDLEVAVDTTATEVQLFAATTPPDDAPEASRADGDDPDDGYVTAWGSRSPISSLLGQPWHQTIGDPVDLDVEQTDTDEVTITWEEPSELPDGEVVSHYLVTEAVSGATYRVESPSTSITLDGYTAPPFFVVRAISDDHVGLPALAGVLYDAPTDVEADPLPASTPGTRSIEVSWTPPASSPSLALPIVGYVVEVREEDGTLAQRTTAAANATSVQVDDLAPATDYDVTVTTTTFFPPSSRSRSAAVPVTTAS
jgi:hypothetical protein